MRKTLDVFYEVPCLTERSSLLNGIVLQKKWFRSADKRIIGQYLQKFIDYNSHFFRFLGVNPFIIGTDQNTAITFRTSEYIGAIPLRASDTGKQIGDFVVMPRFSGHDRFEDYIEILNLLGDEISPEVVESIPLASGKNFRPPLYLEAVKFIASLEELLKTSWKKFDNSEKIRRQPEGQVNWNKYLNGEYKIENKLRFPTNMNFLSEFHQEYSEIRYVFDLCYQELMSSNTPTRIKNFIRPRLQYISEKLYNHKPTVTNYISMRASDNPTVCKCKEHANKILNFNFTESTAWRVNFSDVFEKYVQYMFRDVSREIGGRLFSNDRFNSRSQKYYSWELKHLEPDAVYNKDSTLVFIDAKYKSNLYNKWDDSEILKAEHRHDLHQLLAYTSFSNTDNKFGILCYPSEKVEQKKISYKNAINNATNNVLICGIPLRKSHFLEAKKMIAQELNKY